MELFSKVYKSLNTFSVYTDNNKSSPMHTSYKHIFSLPFEHLNNSMEVTLVLQRFWHWSFFLSIFYYFFIRLIQRALQNRKPFELHIPLLIWNCSLALFSLVALIRFGEDVLHQYLHNGLVNTVCYSCHPNRVAAFWAFLFLISKVVEMGDTVFLALRKRPIIFLHFYHHMAVLVCSIHIGADNAAPSMLYIPMNLFVHFLMYSYYSLMTIGVKMPFWCAMSITSMQTLQMLCEVALTAFVLKLKIVDQIKCQQSYGNLSLIIFLYITFAFLFSHLFYDHYLKKGGKMVKKHSKGNGVMINKKKA